MKIATKFLFTAMLVIAITSCKEDVNLPFNQLNEEDNKELVELSAIEVVKNVDLMKDEAAIEAAISMAGYLSMADPISAAAGQKSMVTTVIEAVASLDSDDTDFYTVMKSVAGPAELTEDPATLQDVWDMLVGTYSWNASLEDWDFEATPTDAIVLKFPSTETGTSNNAMLTISDYMSVTITTPVDEEYDGDVPTSLKWDFTVDGESVMSFTFAAKYNDDGIPSKLASDLTIGDFVFGADVTNNDEEVSESFSFKHKKDVILGLFGGIMGDFTQENIDANTEEYSRTYTEYEYNPVTMDYEEVEVTETWEEVNMEDMVETAQAKFQMYNVSVGCVADVQILIDSIEIIYPDNYRNDQNWDDQAAAIAEAGLMNRHLQMYCIDEDSRKKIADVEAYVVENDNGNGMNSYFVDFRLVFGDESLVDLETYFETGFDNFVIELNSLISDLNTKYDVDIDPMDY